MEEMSATLPAVVFDGVIDVSHHNGAIDWPAVAAGGIALAFIKATQGMGFVDPAFDRNRGAAVKAGVLVVPYHFIDTSDPNRQAGHFLIVTGLGDGELGMLDWETEATVETVVAIGQAVAFRTGRDPVHYYGFAQLEQADPDLSGWPLMLPAYPGGITPGNYLSLVKHAPRLPPGRPTERPYDFHQYTAAGRVAGIAGPVDRSIWVGTKAELRAWYATGALPVPADEDEDRAAIRAVDAEIRALQSGLAALGLYDGKIDGVWGPLSAQAMSYYQRRKPA